jgi:carbonic anhydrase
LIVFIGQLEYVFIIFIEILF